MRLFNSFKLFQHRVKTKMCRGMVRISWFMDQRLFMRGSIYARRKPSVLYLIKHDYKLDHNA